MLQSLTTHYRQAKADLMGRALSRGRLIRTLRAILGDEKFTAQRTRVPRPCGSVFRTVHGVRMRFYTDGSVRHANERAVQRRAFWRARRAARRQAVR